MKYYTEDHEWVEVKGDEAVFGISEYLADELGEVTYVELPEEDDDFIIGDKKQLDMQQLQKYGRVEELKKEDVMR